MGQEVLWTRLFVLCAIAEALLVWLFNRHYLKTHGDMEIPGEKYPYGLITRAVSLLLLAVSACVVISVLGGVIELLMTASKGYFAPEDTFKAGLLRFGSSPLKANILSRLYVNVIDRFIVIFGGYGLSLLAASFLKAGKNSKPQAEAQRSSADKSTTPPAPAGS
jgi:hypothetical protein